jgi:hypothetical protein
MVAPLAIAAGKKAAPVARAAARKVADEPANAILRGVIGLVVVGSMLNRAAGLPGELLGDVGDKLGGAWDRFRQFGEVDIPNLTTKALLYPTEVTNDALAAGYRQSRSVVTGFWQGDLDQDEPGPEYYGRVHYDDSGVPIAVPAEVDRTAKSIGRAIRGAVGDWSIPGF